MKGGVSYGLWKQQRIFFRFACGSFHFVDYCRSGFSLLIKIITRKRKPLPQALRERFEGALLSYKKHLSTFLDKPWI
jgi:hypothetical protein